MMYSRYPTALVAALLSLDAAVAQCKPLYVPADVPVALTRRCTTQTPLHTTLLTFLL